MTEPFYHLKNAKTTLLKAVLVVVIALLFGLIIPGIVAAGGGVFYESTLIGHMPVKAQRSFRAGQATEALLKAKLNEIDSALKKSTSPGMLSTLVKDESAIRSELKTSHTAVVPAPFYLNPIMLVWVAQYTSLGWLLLILIPIKNRIIQYRKDVLQFVVFVVLIYAVYEWTVWMRNFVLGDENRFVYSFANYDICAASFVMQEINTLIFAILLALVWMAWLHYVKECRDEKPDSAHVAEGLTDPQSHDRLLRTYIHWQACSIGLALGFINFTSGFWTIIIRQHDHRYLVAALTIHSIWGLTWLIITLPLLIRWYRWTLTKSAAVRSLWLEEPMEIEVRKFRLELIKETNPFSVFSLSTSGIISLISFFLPILQAFFK
ncbi:hypothetical protein ACFGVR_15160 [Mucilaginibacter sp. AW1-3]